MPFLHHRPFWLLSKFWESEFGVEIFDAHKMRKSYQDRLHARFEAEYQQHLEEGSALMSGKISLVAALVLAHYIN